MPKGDNPSDLIKALLQTAPVPRGALFEETTGVEVGAATVVDVDVTVGVVVGCKVDVSFVDTTGELSCDPSDVPPDDPPDPPEEPDRCGGALTRDEEIYAVEVATVF